MDSVNAKALIYLDQNILGLCAEGTISIRAEEDQLFIYSDEHYREISRSATPELFLEVLQQLKARRLRIQIDESWKMTGNAIIGGEVDVAADYRSFLEAIAEHPPLEDSFDPLLSWINGGENEEVHEEMVEEQRRQLHQLIQPLNSPEAHRRIEESADAFQETVTAMTAQDNDIQKNRNRLGVGKGKIGNLDAGTALEEIWAILEPMCGEMTARQFFGFDPQEWNPELEIPLSVGICSCCAVLDVLGYQAERKTRRLDKMPNIRSDASHLGAASFCHSLVSADRRLIARAEAIFSFVGIKIHTTLVSVSNE